MLTYELSPSCNRPLVRSLMLRRQVRFLWPQSRTCPVDGYPWASLHLGTRRRDGKELFYVSADQKLTAVPISSAGRIEFRRQIYTRLCATASGSS